MEKERVMRVSVEDMVEETIQDTMEAVDNGLKECSGCCLDNEEEVHRVRNAIEKFVREAFRID